jgi:flavin-dependent dehydrogenase
VDWEAEVCVVGGGPAGAALACRLARLGHDVVLVEAEAFPRPHVGESLPPGVLPLLEGLGVRDEVEAAGFLRPRGAIVHWAGVEREQFREDGEPGFQVDRGQFDRILLGAVVSAGARLVQPAQALCPQRGRSGEWVLPLRGRDGNGLTHLRTQFVADACGRRGLLGGRKRRLGPPTVALYGYWRGTGLGGTQSRVEAGGEQWYWGAPLPDGTVNAAVFLAPERLHGGRGPEAVYRQCLAASRLLAGCLTGNLVGGVRACAAAAVVDDEVCGDGWLKVGESAVALDPLSSQGVQTALAGGIQGAAVIHTQLAAPAQRQAALQFARNRQTETARRHAALAAAFYREQADQCPTPFWLERGATADPLPQAPPAVGPLPAPTDRVSVSPRASVVREPALCGDLIRFMPAVIASDSDRPVAFVGGVPIAALVEGVVGSPSVREVLTAWSRLHPPALAARLFLWVLRTGVLVRVP